MFWLWPDGEPNGSAVAPGQQVSGVVESLRPQPCPRAAATTGAAAQPSRVCGDARVHVTTGELAGTTVTAQLPAGAGAPIVAAGDEVVVAHSPGSPEASRFAIIDHQRGLQLWALGAAFALSLIAFGRWRGVTALLGLAFTFGVVLTFMIPSILDGKPPLLVAIVGCAAIVMTVLYLTHGTGRTTTVAIAGTLSSLVLTGLLSYAAVAATRLTGASDETSFLLGQLHGVDLRGLLLAGILVGSLGVLDDVTVTQAVTVQELADANPRYTGRQLYAAAARVGRAHISSVINTIVLAYAGASLPLLVLIVALEDPIGQVLSDQLVATELVRSAVGTIGLITAVPITTGLAAVIIRRGADREH